MKTHFPRGYHPRLVASWKMVALAEQVRAGRYFQLHPSKLGAIDTASRPELSQVSASCAHLETKRTVFHCLEEIMSSPFPVETKIAVFHQFVEASWKMALFRSSAIQLPARRFPFAAEGLFTFSTRLPQNSGKRLFCFPVEKGMT